MPKKAKGLCKRRGCKNELPPLAIKHGDPYCTSACCRLDHGLDVPSGRDDD